MLAYDINCQYSKNIEKRFERCHPESLQILKHIEFVVGKMHLNAHKDDCQFKHSINYTRGGGQFDGEVVERLWAELNLTSSFLKQMGPGHRVDIFTCIVLDANWQKTIGYGEL